MFYDAVECDSSFEVVYEREGSYSGIQAWLEFSDYDSSAFLTFEHLLRRKFDFKMVNVKFKTKSFCGREWINYQQEHAHINSLLLECQTESLELEEIIISSFEKTNDKIKELKISPFSALETSRFPKLVRF